MLCRLRSTVAVVATVTGLLLTASTGQADFFTGTLYYPNYQGDGDNVTLLHSAPVSIRCT